ncbi:hypothetical protein BDY21DRAFT_124396 [Lineolata rhizophorae]|uniref:Uncharacterized protein n=1 Tax=Lineolata rhizophorae TaxID=578093 RepID=A0A6A6NNR4_9PEZI|nr:hypothetical protein BDY21DRAFT_124396 [Lineolata rhizophorae]
MADTAAHTAATKFVFSQVRDKSTGLVSLRSHALYRDRQDDPAAAAAEAASLGNEIRLVGFAPARGDDSAVCWRPSDSAIRRKAGAKFSHMRSDGPGLLRCLVPHSAPTLRFPSAFHFLFRRTVPSLLFAANLPFLSLSPRSLLFPINSTHHSYNGI